MIGKNPDGRFDLQKVNVGADYTPDEVEFLMAVDRYKLESGHKFPCLRELLAVARSLGYRKAEVADGRAG